MRELLLEYAAGTLTVADQARVEQHLAGCADCRADLAGWCGLASAAGADVPAPPAAADLVHRVMVRSVLSASPPPVRRRWSPLDLIAAEVRLLRRRVLVASALVMALGVVLAADTPAATVLALVAPIVAAAGISGVYGPQRDPSFEVVAATPTSPRLILLVRMALIFAYDLVLALAASGVLAATGAGLAGLPALIVAWLGPMALLSALCLALVVWVGADIAIGAALLLWSLRVLAISLFADRTWLVEFAGALWSTNLATGCAAAALVLIAVIRGGFGEPLRRSGATHLT